MDEFKQASLLEREKMEAFLPSFTTTLKDFKYKFSSVDGYDNYDVLMKINNTKAVAEIKIRYSYYQSGYYLEKQKYDSLLQRYPDKPLLYFCITIAGVFVYNLSKIDFNSIRLSNEMLPKTSARKSKKVLKEVYTLPLAGDFVKYYPVFLV